MKLSEVPEFAAQAKAQQDKAIQEMIVLIQEQLLDLQKRITELEKKVD